MKQSTHENFSRDEAASPGSDRTFGLEMAAALALIGAINFHHSGRLWPWELVLAALFLAAALSMPSLLHPLNHLWMKLGLLMMDFVAELWRFTRVRKKFWLLPILVMMVVFGGLVVLTKGTVFAPFIYTLF